MNRVKINPPEQFLPVPTGENRGKYRVYLKPNHSYYFSSKKHAHRFQAICNQFFTQAMYEARTIYIELWVKYQRDWPYFSTYAGGNGGFPLQSAKRKCKTALDNCQENFDFMIANPSWYGFDGNSMVNTRLSNSIFDMQEVASILKQINAGRTAQAELYLLDSLERRLMILKGQLDNFGHTEAITLEKSTMHSKPEIKSPKESELPVLEELQT